MSENKGRYIDQMMAALAKKNELHNPSLKNPDGTTKNAKVRRGTGPVSNKPMKRTAGRGR